MDRPPVKRRSIAALAFVVGIVITPAPTVAQAPHIDTLPPLLREYESRFVPSSYDADTTRQRGILLPVGDGLSSVDSSFFTGDEFVPGFRIQLATTMDIDSANTRKAQAEAAFPSESLFIDFDPPAYKLRAGNFHTRFEADRFARLAAQKGFPDAWPVPTRVLRDPSSTRMKSSSPDTVPVPPPKVE